MNGEKHIITIAALGPDSGEMLTLGVYDALKSADRLLLRTGRHGVAERLTREGVAFETLDALYERTEDFDELCELAARAVIDRSRQAEALVYAVRRGGLRGDSLRREHGEPAHGDGAFHGGDARAGGLSAGHHRNRQPLSRLGCEALAERFV